MKKCQICEVTQPVVRNMPSGRWVLGENQFYKGYSLLLYRFHVEQLHELTPKEVEVFLQDMYSIGKELFEKLHPVRINYAILGNTLPHLHAHIIPRYADDSNPHHSIWNTPLEKRIKLTTIAQRENLLNELI